MRRPMRAATERLASWGAASRPNGGRACAAAAAASAAARLTCSYCAVRPPGWLGGLDVLVRGKQGQHEQRSTPKAAKQRRAALASRLRPR